VEFCHDIPCHFLDPLRLSVPFATTSSDPGLLSLSQVIVMSNHLILDPEIFGPTISQSAEVILCNQLHSVSVCSESITSSKSVVYYVSLHITYGCVFRYGRFCAIRVCACALDMRRVLRGSAVGQREKMAVGEGESTELTPPTHRSAAQERCPTQHARAICARRHRAGARACRQHARI